MPPTLSRTSREAAAACGLAVALTLGAALAACSKSGPPKPQHREPAPDRDTSCADPERPKAYFYPAENRTDYKPDDPWKDRCVLLVPDHLFCCPAAGER
jgi:hypothetical protein